MAPISKSILWTAIGIVEMMLYLAGLLAALNMLRALAVIVELVTIGPVGGGVEIVHRLFEAISVGWIVGYREINAAGAVLCFVSLFLAWRVRKRWGNHYAALIVQAAAAFWLLVYSYRLLGLVALAITIGWQVVSVRTGWRPLLVWGISALLCLVPYDVSLRNLDGPGRMETRLHCSTVAATMEYKSNQRVCVGSDAPAYNEPTQVWVW